MALKTQLNRILIVLDAFLRGHKKSKNKKVSTDKTVLIVFQQIFGDAVVIQNSLKEYGKLFPQNQGYRIKFLVRPSVAAFMEATMGIPEYMEICKVDFKKFLEEYTYYKNIVKTFRGTADILIVPGTRLSAEIFSAASDASRKIGLVYPSDVTRPIIMAVFARVAYTEKVRPPKDYMMLQRHRLLLHYLGDREYKAQLPELLPKDSVIAEKQYCVMCPGSSKMEKCWPTERFAEVADYIIVHYDMNIHLCGGANEIEFEEKIFSDSKYPERIVSHIGTTNFSDWSAIVQHADLVLGNDSATLHLAAASRRKAICIAGVYDKYQFFPYKVDELADGDRLPVTLIKDMPCEWCKLKSYDAGFGNEECGRRIAANQCACCINLISTQEVIEQIDLLMK